MNDQPASTDQSQRSCGCPGNTWSGSPVSGPDAARTHCMFLHDRSSTQVLAYTLSSSQIELHRTIIRLSWLNFLRLMTTCCTLVPICQRAPVWKPHALSALRASSPQEQPTSTRQARIDRNDGQRLPKPQRIRN